MFSLKTLEFDKVLHAISLHALTNFGAKVLLSCVPSKDSLEIKNKLARTERARVLAVKYGSPSLTGLNDLDQLTKKIDLSAILGADELFLLATSLQIIKEIKEYQDKLELDKEEYQELEEIFSGLDMLVGLKKTITKCIGPSYEIQDKASVQLESIRKEIASLTNLARNKMYGLLTSKSSKLTENYLVFRQERMCLAVKVSEKNAIKGIVHGESSSGTTIYIEPAEVSEITNKITLLQNDEKAEIHRILNELSKKTHEKAIEIAKNYENLLNVDIVFALARYAIKEDCIIPDINDENYLDLKGIRHPLISQKDAVCNDFILGNSYQTLIITGSNTGGKTVLLKTVGLLCLMVQIGSLIPVKAGSIAIFDHILADIGDEQSIEQSLSSFSGHIKNVNSILAKANNRSLIIFDELGSGTDPKEGVNLAIAITEYLLEKHSLVLISTHYDGLKVFANNHPNVENASFLFDTDTLKPKYQLQLGIPGISHALIIAKGLGLPKSIYERALVLAEKEKTELDIMLEGLTNAQKKLDIQADRVAKISAEIADKETNLVRLEQELANREAKLAEKAQKKATEIIESAQEKARMLLAEITSKEQFSEHEVAKIKYDIRNLDQIEAEQATNEAFKLGDKVLIKSCKMHGVISKISKDRYEVTTGQLRIAVPVTDLAKSSIKEEKPKPVKRADIKITSFIPRLDLRGFRYIDVGEALDKFLDDALMHNVHEVTIVHGFGTGTIRKAVWEVLKSHSNVASYRYGGENEGQNGATVVSLK